MPDIKAFVQKHQITLICVLFLFFLPIYMFSDVVVGGKTFVGHDLVQWRAGAESIIQDRKVLDDEPLWLTNMFAGMPAYLVSYLRAVPNLDDFIALFNAIHPAPYYWVMLFGAFLLFRTMGWHPFAATFSSIMIGFTTYIPIIIGAGHNTKFIAFSFIPWVVYGYYLVMHTTTSRLWSMAVFALALTLELRANHPQVAYYFAFFLAIWWLFDAYKAKSNHDLARFSRLTGLLLAGILLAGLANLQPYWSVAEYSSYSIRGGSAIEATTGLNQEYAFTWSQGWGELLTLIIPGVYGGSSFTGTYWGPKPVTSGPHYLGAIAFLLLLIGLFKSKSDLKWVWLSSGIVSMLFSLGNHFALLNDFMFAYFPYFNKFRTPEMWLIVTIFSGASLAGLGLHWLLSQKEHSLSQLYIPAGIALALALTFSIGTDSVLNYEKKDERAQMAQQLASANNLSPTEPRIRQAISEYLNKELKPARRAEAVSSSQRFLVFTLLGLGAIAAFSISKLSLIPFAVLIILFGSFDLLQEGRKYIPESALAPGNMDRTSLVEQRRRPVDTWLQKQVETSEGWKYRVLPLADNVFNDAVPAYFYPSLGGYTGAKMSRYQDVLNEALFQGGRSGLNLDILSMLNTKYVTSRQPLPYPSLKQIDEFDGILVYENTNVLPKAWFVESIIEAKNAKEAIKALSSFEFDPSFNAIIETGTTTLPALQADPAAQVTVTSYGPRSISLKTKHANGGLLVLGENHYPKGWQAFIDGEETSVFPVNYLLRGIQVPAGEHELVFTFNPASHVWGSRIAWMAHAALFFLLCAAAYPYIRTFSTSHA